MGTIFGVWPGDKLKGITGRDQAAAGMGVFGPRTCFVIALKDAPGCHEFLLQDDGEDAWRAIAKCSTAGSTLMLGYPGVKLFWRLVPIQSRLIFQVIGQAYCLPKPGSMLRCIRGQRQVLDMTRSDECPPTCAGKWLHVKETTEIGEGKMFSPGNLRATFDNPECAAAPAPAAHQLQPPLLSAASFHDMPASHTRQERYTTKRANAQNAKGRMLVVDQPELDCRPDCICGLRLP